MYKYRIQKTLNEIICNCNDFDFSFCNLTLIKREWDSLHDAEILIPCDGEYAKYPRTS